MVMIKISDEDQKVEAEVDFRKIENEEDKHATIEYEFSLLMHSAIEAYANMHAGMSYREAQARLIKLNLDTSELYITTCMEHDETKGEKQ